MRILISPYSCQYLLFCSICYNSHCNAAKSLQSCLTLCDPIDSSPSGSPFPGVLPARTLEWVAISFSNAWKWKVNGKSLSCVRLFVTPWTAAYQAPPSMGFSRQEYWSGVPSPSPAIVMSMIICLFYHPFICSFVKCLLKIFCPFYCILVFVIEF